MKGTYLHHFNYKNRIIGLDRLLNIALVGVPTGTPGHLKPDYPLMEQIPLHNGIDLEKQVPEQTDTHALKRFGSINWLT